MSELTRKLLFSYEVVEQELARCRAEMREQIAKEIETHDDSSPFPCGCQNIYADIVRGKKE